MVAWAEASFVLVLVGTYPWIHGRHPADPATAVQAETQRYAEEEQAGQLVRVGILRPCGRCGISSAEPTAKFRPCERAPWGDTLFSADDTSIGEVNFTLPPTFNQPAKRYLVFRSSSHRASQRVVQADFRIDF